MILVIDNYDSFAHNLARYLREAGAMTDVRRNDAMSAEAFVALRPSGVVLSPGPKSPKEAGACLPLLALLPATTPVLGVCLGSQCLAQAFGWRTQRARAPLHGEASLIRHDGQGVFSGIASPMAAGRYHSLISAPGPDEELVVCAWSEEGEVMGVRRRTAPWHGVQFHPESLLTPCGRALIANFVAMTKGEFRP
ncbi:MAG: aminodeoxychorismate/anthranilate synthase component II [Alphaproteobacteria bacterium]|nr:aminodeoxychorismate/anthranilate synthase component II [Alphaproteobacteria bacterium]